MNEDDDYTQTWTEEPPEEPEPVRVATGYVAAITAPPAARGETIAVPAQTSRGPYHCASCGRSYAIRSFGECVFCQGNRNRQNHNAVRDAIRELKDGRANPEQERRLIKQLHELGHPDLKGLLDTLAAQREAPTKARR